MDSSDSGVGNIGRDVRHFSFRGSDPGAGLVINETVPSERHWRLLDFSAGMLKGGGVTARIQAPGLDESIVSDTEDTIVRPLHGLLVPSGKVVTIIATKPDGSVLGPANQVAIGLFVKEYQGRNG